MRTSTWCTCAGWVYLIFMPWQPLSAQHSPIGGFNNFNWYTFLQTPLSANAEAFRADQPVYKLDSLTGIQLVSGKYLAFRTSYTYDAQGRPTAIEQAQSLFNAEKTGYAYSQSGNRNTMTTTDQVLDPLSQSWINVTQQEENYWFKPTGDQLATQTWEWNYTANKWSPQSKTTVDFFSDGEYRSSYQERWNALTQAFVPEYQSIRIRDQQNRLTDIITYRKPSNKSELIPMSHTILTYLSNDRVNYEVKRYWDDINNLWGRGDSTAYAYLDEAGEQTRTHYLWYSYIKAYTPIDRIITRYDKWGQEIYYLSQSWMTSKADWHNITRIERQYHLQSPGFLLEEAVYSWDYYKSIWQGDSKEAWTYDDRFQVIRLINYYWDTGLQQWQYDWQYRVEADYLGNPTSITWTLWNSDRQEWENLMKGEVTWDYFPGQIYQLQYEVPDVRSLEGITIPTKALCREVTAYLWSPATESWEANQERMTYHWSALVATAAQDYQEKGSIQLYPNPCTDFLIITGDETKEALFTVGLYDISGQLLQSFSFQQSIQLNVNELPPGVYLVNVAINGQILRVQKVVKVRDDS